MTFVRPSRKRRAMLAAGAVAAVASPLAAGAATQILVPAYFDPSDGNDWNVMAASASPTVPITAIMNPYNGPVSTADAGYTQAIANLQSAGGNVIGYVHAKYGNRSLASVEGDVATYRAEYPNLNGIFVDEMDDTTAGLTYFRNLYAYIKSENPAWEVIGNPGEDTLPSYFSPQPAADVLTTFEADSGYAAYRPPAWEAAYNASSFANIAYAVSGVPTMQADVAHAVSVRAGSVFVTDAGAGNSNPYGALPSYWAQEVAAVAAANAATVRSTYSLNGSGDFNVPGNWSAGVPDAAGAEADFLGAITSAQTVSTSLPITLGTVVFDNAKTYTIAGTGSLTLDASSGAAVIVRTGTQRINLPVTVAGATVFNVSAGAALVVGSAVAVNAGQRLTEAGAGSFALTSTVSLGTNASAALQPGTAVGQLALGAGSTAAITAPPAGTAAPVQLGGITFAAGSTFDLSTAALVIHNGNPAAVAAAVAAGAAGGSGFFSSAARADATHLSAVGTALNGTAATPLFSTFEGVPVVATDVLVRLTYYGDANLDGAVNAADYTRIDAGFVGRLSGWVNGDFNGDGAVDGSDYTLMDNAFNRQAGGTAAPAAAIAWPAAVPEPTGVGLLLAIGTLAGRRHWRREPLP